MNKSILLLISPLLISLGSITSYAQGNVSTMVTRTEPKPVGPVPTEAQMAWQKLETYAFVHFGLNTYNDLEWGYGNTPASTFNPKKLDTDQWVRTFKEAGLKAVILTAKHHDGFCLWPTETVDYSVKNSPWMGGQGDLVRDLSASCRKYGLKFGLYLSPWDRHNAEYGREGYQKVFHQQIKELTSNYGPLFEYWFDGANGGTGWYGGADEARSINPKEYYKYEEAAELLRANNPDIMIFGGTVPTIRWIGNEQGWAGETNYSTYSKNEEKHYRENIWGHRNGTEWLPGEVDVSIRPGWFYHHREDHQVRSVANLTNLYYQSVGRNANLLLNFPINLEGVIPQTDSLNAVHWHQHISKAFSHNLLKGAKVEATTGSRDGYQPSDLVDGNDDTYWVAKEPHSAELIITLPSKQKLNNIMLQEYIRLGQRVEGFQLETRDAQGQWQAIDTRDSLTTIGYKRIIRLAPVETDAIRVRFTKSKDVVCLAEVAAYFAPELVDAPDAYRDEQDRLVIRAASPKYALKYRLGRQKTWQVYSGPVAIPSDHLTVEVMADSGSDRAKKTVSFGYSAKNITVEGLTSKQHQALFDGNGYTPISLPKEQKALIFTFDKTRKIRSFIYTPNQQRDASGHIQKYRLYVDNKLVAEGEFQNIKANPIPVEIVLNKPHRGRQVKLEVLRILDDKDHLVIGDIAIK